MHANGSPFAERRSALKATRQKLEYLPYYTSCNVFLRKKLSTMHRINFQPSYTIRGQVHYCPTSHRLKVWTRLLLTHDTYTTCSVKTHIYKKSGCR